MPRKRACDSCHEKKISCDGGSPRCDWCNHRNLKCTYDRATASSRKRPQPAEFSLQDEIEERLERLESLLQGLRRTDRGDPSPPAEINDKILSKSQPPSHGGIFYGSLYFAGCHLGDISSRNGIPIFSDEGRKWVQDRTGEIAALERGHEPSSLDLDAALNGLNNLALLGGQNAALLLPTKTTAQCCLDIFRASTLQLVFPVVDLNTFQDTIDRAYEETTESTRAMVCVLAFISFLSLLEPQKTAELLPNAEIYATKAQQMLLLTMAEPTIEGLQAALLLCLYLDFSGQLQAASMLHSLASRSLFMLGGHLKPKPPSGATPDDARLRHLRTLFWLCYFCDKHISLRTGQPHAIADDQCDLALCDDYPGLDFIDLKMDGPSLTQYLPKPLQPSDLGLTIIKSKVFSLLFTPSALKKSDTEILHTVRMLDEELERWRLSVPQSVRPSLSSVTDPADPSLQHEFGMLLIFVRFEYLYLLSAIHRACGRCQAWSIDGGVPNAVRSSLLLSVEASRSTLVYLKVASEMVHRESFWLVIFYPLWASVTLFCNILYKPSARHAQSDVELVSSVPYLLKKLRARDTTPSEALHLQRLETFIAELIHLANKAIYKHRIENPTAQGKE
ncbi:unnamed protein product [Clonostachys rosea]|uniref:Zn(2)-C6 fungal-type domain-containing protein n=1 Tax=Bionectria ochroleuca TaxID=29856 RepID=A0ABY6V0N2_BIOOC|nr:unnamed protein product [Clonostachys rosea]